MAAATERVFSEIPGTTHPSLDGKLYLQQGYDVISGGLAAGGWQYVTANDQPGLKNKTYGNTAYMYSHGERGGPMATYLVDAAGRSNFDLWMNTAVRRVLRSSGHAMGVEVEAYMSGGYQGVVNLTAATGRVVLSAGTFGTAKLLLRSGIGPSDQLAVVKNSTTDGPTMINQEDWIYLPVGYNLDDHCNVRTCSWLHSHLPILVFSPFLFSVPLVSYPTNHARLADTTPQTDTVIEHPDVVFYDFYAAYNTPNQTDADDYLGSYKFSPLST